MNAVVAGGRVASARTSGHVAASHEKDSPRGQTQGTPISPPPPPPPGQRRRRVAPTYNGIPYLDFQLGLLMNI